MNSRNEGCFATSYCETFAVEKRERGERGIECGGGIGEMERRGEREDGKEEKGGGRKKGSEGQEGKRGDKRDTKVTRGTDRG